MFFSRISFSSRPSRLSTDRLTISCSFPTSVIQSAKANETEDTAAGLPTKYTKDELDGVHLHMIGLEEWFGERADKQKDLPQNEDPVITTAELDEKGRTFQDKVLKLIKRKAPAVPKPKKEEVKKDETDSEEKEPKEEEMKGEEKEEVVQEEPGEETRGEKHNDGPEIAHKKDEL